MWRLYWSESCGDFLNICRLIGFAEHVVGRGRRRQYMPKGLLSPLRGDSYAFQTVMCQRAESAIYAQRAPFRGESPLTARDKEGGHI